MSKAPSPTWAVCWEDVGGSQWDSRTPLATGSGSVRTPASPWSKAYKASQGNVSFMVQALLGIYCTLKNEGIIKGSLE